MKTFVLKFLDIKIKRFFGGEREGLLTHPKRNPVSAPVYWIKKTQKKRKCKTKCKKRKSRGNTSQINKKKLMTKMTLMPSVYTVNISIPNLMKGGKLHTV